jgi:ubiquinone/menaquinone biosynthesis C-methylase UbiE
MAKEPVRHETYRHSEQYTQQVMAQRSVGQYLAFLLPHLQPGMRLLDCGCGVGSITVDLAQHVAPGAVIGIDLREADLDRARRLATERAIANVQFHTASIYALPFPDASFDAVVAHAVLQHLGDPLAAMREMRRVLRAGGVIGLSDTAWQHQARYPTNPILEAWEPLWARAIVQRGGSPSYSPRQRELLRAAGFARTEGFAGIVGPGSLDGAGTLATTRAAAQADIARLREVVAPIALEEGWATEAELEAMAEALAAWGEDPDALAFRVRCTAIGWA